MNGNEWKVPRALYDDLFTFQFFMDRFLIVAPTSLKNSGTKMSEYLRH